MSPVPVHTGEQIYLRHNFKELIGGNAVHVVGPDPADMGGLAELKWVAEYVDLHQIMVAPQRLANSRPTARTAPRMSGCCLAQPGLQVVVPGSCLTSHSVPSWIADASEPRRASGHPGHTP